MFIVVLFFWKNKSSFQNRGENALSDAGLTAYSTETIENIVKKDTDGDGIEDWQETLFGLDPTKKETAPGTPDGEAVEKIKSEAGQSGNGEGFTSVSLNEDLTETEKFSRELFSTIASLNQEGNIDQAAIDALGAALAEKIQNPAPQKIYLLADIRISERDDSEAVRNYADSLTNIEKTYTVNYTVLDVLYEFSKDENEVDVKVLEKLDPIIRETRALIDKGLQVSVPRSLATLHLNVINSLQRLTENMNDIKKYEEDAIIFFGAVSQYTPNTLVLEADMNKLQNAIREKLGN